MMESLSGLHDSRLQLAVSIYKSTNFSPLNLSPSLLPSQSQLAIPEKSNLITITIKMKPNYNLITLLFLLSIFLLATLPISTARYLAPDYIVRRRSPHRKRGPDRSWDTHDTSRGEYTCDVTKASPFKSDVEDVADELGARAQKAMCNWDSQYECTTVATQGSAEAELCGIWNGGMPCRAVGKIVNRIIAKCAHHFWGDAEPRASGKAVFDWGTIIVS